MQKANDLLVFIRFYFSSFTVTGDSIMHPGGAHKHQFSFQLPLSLPSSFEGAHGYVRYWAKACMDRPWKFNHDTKSAFTVICPVRLERQCSNFKGKVFFYSWTCGQKFFTFANNSDCGHFIVCALQIPLRLLCDRVASDHILGRGPDILSPFSGPCPGVNTTITWIKPQRAI